jgi:hypothetical protein
MDISELEYGVESFMLYPEVWEFWRLRQHREAGEFALREKLDLKKLDLFFVFVVCSKLNSVKKKGLYFIGIGLTLKKNWMEGGIRKMYYSGSLL